MELNACVLALKNSLELLKTHHFSKIIIFTDSNYVYENYRNAMFVWCKNGWRKKGGGPVINAHLWKDLVRGIQKTRLYFECQKVKGHSKDEHNKAVDKLAKLSSTIPTNKPLLPRIVRRKKCKEITRVGCVGVNGQRITIRIIQGEYLKIQHLYRYRYEVLSKKISFFEKVDFICSYLIFREGHTYYVKFNAEQSNPMILKQYTEKKSNKVVDRVSQ